MGSASNPVVFRITTTDMHGIGTGSQHRQGTYKSINDKKEVIIHHNSDTYNASGVKTNE